MIAASNFRKMMKVCFFLIRNPKALKPWQFPGKNRSKIFS